MEIKDFKLELDWIDKYCPTERKFYYDFMNDLIAGFIGGGLFPIIELDSPVYYNGGKFRCDAFYLKDGKCRVIEREYGENGDEFDKDLNFIPYMALRESINKILELKYHF